MKEEFPIMQGAVCPVPLSQHKTIVLGHGSGGKMSHDLITHTFLDSIGNPIIGAGNDAGLIEDIFSKFPVSEDSNKLAISTDSHVVWPLFFPGGDIGSLAVCGTVNDVAMLGAKPAYLTAGFILEEGLDFNILERIIDSMQSAAKEAEILFVAGDTKVVQKGKADSIYINTSGIGVVPSSIYVSGENAQAGDIIILSGSIGDHGIAVLEARGELGFSSGIESDIAPLNHLVDTILKTGGRNVHVLRDPTRGGLATSLNEIARQSQVDIEIEEATIPVKGNVQAACEMLGFDPLFIANEGKLIAFVAKEASDNVIAAMRQTKYGDETVAIGRVLNSEKGRVLMRTKYGTTRMVDMLSGEMLPRIC